MNHINEFDVNYRVNDNDRRVAISIVVKTERDIKDANYSNGIEHFIEHIFVKRLKDKVGEISKIYGETNKLYTYYSLVGDEDYFNYLIDSINVVINAEKIIEKEIKNELPAILEELNFRQSDKIFKITEEIFGKYYSESFNIIGNKEELCLISETQLNNFVKEKYIKGKVYISICGRNNIVNSNTMTDNVPKLYKNCNDYHIHFIIPGIKNEIFYTYYIFKNMIEDFLKKQSLKVKVHIIKVSSNKSYFVINIIDLDEKIYNINDIIKSIDFKLCSFTSYKEYANNFYRVLNDKMNINEFKAVFTSIMNCNDLSSIYENKKNYFQYCLESDYQKSKKYIELEKVVFERE